MRYQMFDDLYETMPWDLIDNVVFDVGNVLLAFDPQHILDEYLPEAKEYHPILIKKIFQSPYWVMRDHGVISEEDAISCMTGRDTQLAPMIRKVMTSWIEMKDVLSDGLSALHACKAHGKKVYVLSNYAEEPFDHVDQKYDFFHLFDGKVISSHVKLMKPDPAIYSHVIHKFDLIPSRTLFLDDAPANIETALLMGWQGILVNRPGKLKEFFCEGGQL